MRIGLALASGLLTLAGCWGDQPTNRRVISTKDGPPAALVSIIENELPRDPCLSQVAKMRREYRFSQRRGKVIRNLIDVQVTKAGHDGLPAGIFILPPNRSYEFDDRNYFLALATYGVKEEDLDIWVCGTNAGGGLRHDPRF